jgi:hypothetical protein
VTTKQVSGAKFIFGSKRADIRKAYRKTCSQNESGAQTLSSLLLLKHI